MENNSKLKKKKQLIRDSLIVLPFLLFTLIWLVLGLGFQVDFSPYNSYGASMLFNLIIPLLLIGVGSTIYAVILILDAVNAKDRSLGVKILYGIAAWLLTVNLYFLVYLFRLIVFCFRKNK